MGCDRRRNTWFVDMIRRRFIHLMVTALVFRTVVACTSIPRPEFQDGTVTISFSTGEPLTRAGELGDGVVDDGGGIAVTADGPDLIILIADAESGVIKKRYAPGATDGVTITATPSGESATEISTSFTWGDTPGTGIYTVYALANTGDMGNLSIGGAPAWSTLGNVSGLDDLLFNALSDNTTPSVSGHRMPLSAKGTLEVRKNTTTDKYNGLVELRMLRCVAKVQLYFKNLTGEVLNISDCQLILHDMNPSQGYIFPHDADFVEDSYRDHTTPEKNLLKIGATETPKKDGVDGRMLMGDYEAGPPVVDSRVPAALDEFLVFPSTAPWQTTPSKGYRYLCDITFKIDDDLKEFVNLPIHDKLSRDILSLSRNQFLKIETTISSKADTKDISFNFIVCNWTKRKEEVIFH